MNHTILEENVLALRQLRVRSRAMDTGPPARAVVARPRTSGLTDVARSRRRRIIDPPVDSERSYMPWKRGQPYRYNLAEWLGAFLALIGTPALLFQVLGVAGILPIPPSLASAIFFGGIAVTGWVLLLLGTRAHRRVTCPQHC